MFLKKIKFSFWGELTVTVKELQRFSHRINTTYSGCDRNERELHTSIYCRQAYTNTWLAIMRTHLLTHIFQKSFEWARFDPQLRASIKKSSSYIFLFIPTKIWSFQSPSVLGFAGTTAPLHTSGRSASRLLLWVRGYGSWTVGIVKNPTPSPTGLEGTLVFICCYKGRPSSKAFRTHKNMAIKWGLKWNHCVTRFSRPPDYSDDQKWRVSVCPCQLYY